MIAGQISISDVTVNGRCGQEVTCIGYDEVNGVTSITAGVVGNGQPSETPDGVALGTDPATQIFICNTNGFYRYPSDPQGRVLNGTVYCEGK